MPGLSFQITNSSNCAVFVYVQAPSTLCNITYMDASNNNQATSVNFTGTNILSDPIPFDNILNGTFTVNEVISGVIYFTYGSQFSSCSAAPVISTCNVPFSVVEITLHNPPVAGDAGDLTAINYFTGASVLSSYDGSENLLQQKSFSVPSSTIFSKLYALTPDALVMNCDNSAPVRVLSAYEYATQGSNNPYPGFGNYLNAVANAGQKTNINNQSAWNNPANTSSGDYTNYNFQFTFTATVNESTDKSYCDVNLTNGEVVVTAITYTNFQPATPVVQTVAKNLSIKMSGSNSALLNQLIYGQTINSAVTFSDSGTDGWTDLQTYISTNVPGQSVDETLKSMIIGEITSGFVFGFINSNEIPAGLTIAIKDMPSNQWWGLDPVNGYNNAQPNNAYYDPFAAVICNNSGNQVYGAAYGDRFTNPSQNPTIESAVYNNTNVAKWTLELLPPITVPATAVAVMEDGVVLEVEVLNSGSGYMNAPVVSIQSPGNGGMQAQAVATIANGQVTGITVTNGGSQYDFSPQVSISPAN